MIKLTPYVASWIVLAVLVLGLALYRRILSMHADNYVPFKSSPNFSVK